VLEVKVEVTVIAQEVIKELVVNVNTVITSPKFRKLRGKRVSIQLNQFLKKSFRTVLVEPDTETHSVKSFNLSIKEVIKDQKQPKEEEEDTTICSEDITVMMIIQTSEVIMVKA